MKFKDYIKEYSVIEEGGFVAAFFISPKGEIVYTPIKHIESVIRHPEKFGLNREFIEYVHNFYNERIGQEGKAREQILLSLIKKGWIRLRRYRNFWSINVPIYTKKVKEYLQKWANMLLKGKLEFKEDDPYMDIKISQDSGKIISSSLEELTKNIKESKDNPLKSVKIEEMEDLQPYDFVEKFMKGNKNDKKMSDM